ncbi:hypothetical protein GCM10025734_04280 [Kitasatospora paranensis]
MNLHPRLSQRTGRPAPHRLLPWCHPAPAAQLQPQEILSQLDEAKADTDRMWSRTARRWADLIQDRRTDPAAAAAH